MSEQPPPQSDQPPPSYQPPPPSYQPPPPNPLIPQGSQRRKGIFAGINPRIFAGINLRIGVAVVAGIVLLVVFLFLLSQLRGTSTADQSDRIALEQTIVQNTIMLAVLQTQAASNQASALQPTQPPQVITSPPQIIVQPTQAPQIITATPLPQVAQATAALQVKNTLYNCPDYRPTGIGKSLTITVDVPTGQIAFIDAYSLDNKVNGVFATITGPYKGTHTFRDGAYCGGINVTDDYQPVLSQRIEAVKKGGNYVEIHLGSGG